MKCAQFNLQSSGTTSATVTIPTPADAKGGKLAVIDYIYAVGVEPAASIPLFVDVSCDQGIILITGKTIGTGESDTIPLEFAAGGLLCQRSTSGTVPNRDAVTNITITAQCGGASETHLTVGFHYERP